MQIALSVIAAGGLSTDAAGAVPAQLVTPPEVTGAAVPGGSLALSGPGAWSLGGVPATVVAADYALTIGGLVADGPRPEPALSIPAGAGGAAYGVRLRVELAEDPGRWSAWQGVAAGLVAAPPVLSGAVLGDAGGGSFAATVVTDTGDGVLHWLLAPEATPPAPAELRAAAAQPVTAAGPQSLSGPAPAPGITAYLHLLQVSGAGLESAVLTSPPLTLPATLPGAFGPGDWSLADAGTGGAATLGILALPEDGGSTLTSVIVSVSGVALPPLAPATGVHALTGPFTDGVAAEVTLRAVNAVGAGPESAPKTVTPTAPQAWAMADLANGRFSLSAAPPPAAPPVTTDLGDGRFAVAA